MYCMCLCNINVYRRPHPRAKGAIYKWRHSLRGRGHLPKSDVTPQVYLVIWTTREREGKKNLKKLVTFFMDGPKWCRPSVRAATFKACWGPADIGGLLAEIIGDRVDLKKLLLCIAKARSWASYTGLLRFRKVQFLEITTHFF